MSKSIKLQSLKLTNFKGAIDLTVELNQITNIYGANGLGKTTIYDAFLWLAFGKNSEDRKDFNIKNTINTDLNRQDHEVEGVLVIDGEANTLKRVYREKWTKKKGSEFPEYTGNETLYYWNEVPMQQKEFQAKINSVLDESVFKMVTNPMAFNALKWQDRRSVLLQITGDITDTEIAQGNPQYEALIAKLTQGKTMEDYRKQIIASITKSKADLKAIPTRIDEVLRGKPAALDFSALKIQLVTEESKLNEIESLISDKVKANEAENNRKIEIQNKIHAIKTEISNIEFAAKEEANKRTKIDTSALDGLRSQLTNKEADHVSYNNALTTLNRKLENITSSINDTEKSIDTKRTDWNNENAKELKFDDSSFCCPTCKRDFEATDIKSKKSDMQSNFIDQKAKTLRAIEADAERLKAYMIGLQNELTDTKVRIETGKKEITEIETSINTLKESIETENAKSISMVVPNELEIIESILSSDKMYITNKASLSELEIAFAEIKPIDNSELHSRKSEILSEINSLNTLLTTEDRILDADKRIGVLKSEEATLAQQIAAVEKEQFLIENFEKMKMDALEQKVNSRFQMVKFKMFETQVNGGESACCEILVNGVPFADANTASKINAGLDIINVLCKYYDITAPIFIDNRESCTEIIESDSQIISLIVSPSDKSLKVA